MLLRRLIMDHALLVLDGLSSRFLGPEIKEAVLKIQGLGRESLQIQKEKEALQQERNTIAKSFKDKGTDKEALKVRGSKVKQKIEELEKWQGKIEEELVRLEGIVPNLPDPWVPISGVNADEKRSALHLLHHYRMDLESSVDFVCLDCQEEFRAEDLDRLSETMKRCVGECKNLVYLKSCKYCEAK